MESFDSERALQELEKLREQILEARAERGRIEAAFDAFTSGFHSTRSPQDRQAVPAPPSRTREARINDSTSVDLPPAPSAEPMPVVPVAVPSPAPRRRNRRVLVGVGAGIGVAIAAATFALRDRRSAPDIAAPAPTSAEPARIVQPPPAAAVAPPAQAPVPAGGVNVEIVTRRRVWIRVMLDGKRAFEREVPAEERIPLRAEHSIVIRAGDAGAVAVVWNGQDAGPLGRDGIAMTRQFTSSAKQ